MCSMFSQQRNLGTHKIHEFSEWFPVSRDNSDHMKADRKNSVKDRLPLNSKLGFNEHSNNKISKCNKIIAVMKKLSLILSRKTMLTIHKSFVRPNFDYTHIIYDKPVNKSF